LTFIYQCLKIESKMKILFLTQTTQKGPASRYRVYQYIDYLRENDIQCDISSALPDSCYEFFYQNTNIFKKILLLPLIFVRRIRDLFRVNNYECVFIQRDILPQLFPIFETLIYKLNKNIIFDFDDAIFLIPPQRNKAFYFLRDNQAIQKIISLSSQIIVGNDYLKQYALKFNKQVELIPTAIDTKKWIKADKETQDKRKIIIGWIGTRHNLFYLNMLKSVFKQLSEKHDICLHIISDANFKIKGIDINNIPWAIKTELEEVQKFDIAIAPLRDDAWGKGKCGLKALQCMACSIPTVCSEDGVYKQIIVDNLNGFLAKNEKQWLSRISLLINSPKLRVKIGQAGREIVEADYSRGLNAIKLKQVIEKFKEK